MARLRGAVLVDTNVIIEAWRIDAWRALAGGYVLETVEKCVIETQTGHQNRRPEQQIDQNTLLAGLKATRSRMPSAPQLSSATAKSPRSMRVRRRFGHMRSPVPMPGCSVAPTRQACASVYDSIFANGSFPLNAFSTTPDFVRGRRSKAPIVRIG